VPPVGFGFILLVTVSQNNKAAAERGCFVIIISRGKLIMNKLIFVMIAGMVSLSAHAATGLTMMVAPGQPAVFKSDYTAGDVTVKGPWFQTQEFFNTDIEANVAGFEFTVTSAEGKVMTYAMTQPVPIRVVPGTTAHTEIMILGSLPISSSYTYDVQVKVLGTYIQKGEAINLIGEFKTQ